MGKAMRDLMNTLANNEIYNQTNVALQSGDTARVRELTAYTQAVDNQIRSHGSGGFLSNPVVSALSGGVSNAVAHTGFNITPGTIQDAINPIAATVNDYNDNKKQNATDATMLNNMTSAAQNTQWRKDNPTPGLLNPNDYGGSAELMATAVTQAQFADWANTFVPLERDQLQQSSLMNPGVIDKAVNSATDQTNQTFNTLAGVEKRRLNNYGIDETAGQEQASSRVRDMSRSLALSTAKNNARKTIANQDDLIALGTAPNPKFAVGG